MRLIDADAFKKYISEGYYDTVGMFKTDEYRMLAKQITESILSDIDEQPTIQPEKAQLSQQGTTKDTISRQAALEKVRTMQTYKLFMGDDMILVDKAEVQTELMMLPPAQPELTDINAKEAVYNLAEKIGIHQLFALTVELRGEPIQTEPAIPLSWTDKYIEWLKSLDNEFANLAAAHISVMVKKWRDEQNERPN